MTTQDTEAGKLASQLRDEAQEWFHLHGVNATSALCEQSAAELDRLVAIKDELVRALELTKGWLSTEPVWHAILTLPNETFGHRIDAALASARSQEKTP